MRKGLLGKRLSHSYSKIIHERLTDYQYDLFELNEEELTDFLKQRDFDGVNVTIPYKQTVIPYLDELDESAAMIGAVNTIVHRDGKLIGYNTDYSGFISMLRLNQIEIKNRKVLVLGNGGAAKAVTAALNALGAREIIKVKPKANEQAISYEECYQYHTDAQVIINTSPVGMYPDVNQSPIDLTPFTKLESVGDIVYNPIKTRLLTEAELFGLKTAKGMEMLVGQAVDAIMHFTGIRMEDNTIEKMTQELIQQKQNLVLIGMPGSGKTTISKMLGKRLNIPVIETDQLVIDKIKMEIKDYFALYGEEKFREIETQVAHEIAAETGVIISCGGGIVLREENMKSLKMNGKVLFIDRDVEKLAVSDSRPLSPDKECVRKLYKERIDLYQRYQDITIDNNADLDDALAQCLFAKGK